ncbi:hypothetical protein AYO47_00085 [Planctomyces sp. SCGC AG-212-M04]|nr:hypothetical protein AYO47_00085 [Planctomyces sp. SCGC AG-212-M04]
MGQTRRFLMSRPGLLEGHRVPLRLNVLDTVGTIVEVVWRIAAIPFAVLLVKAVASRGLIPRDAGIVMLLIGINFVALEYGVTWILMASCRRFAVLFGIASEKEAAFFPLPAPNSVASPWPAEWQQPTG